VKFIFIVLIVAVVLAFRLWLFRRRRDRRNQGALKKDTTVQVSAKSFGAAGISSDVGLVAAREIKERVRGRVFRIGTLLILAVVAGAIVIPKLDSNNNSATSYVKVGIVGTLPSVLRTVVVDAGKSVGFGVRFVGEPDKDAAERLVRNGQLDLAIVDGSQILVSTNSDTTNGGQVAQAAAQDVGVTKVFESNGLTPAQIAGIDHAKALPIVSLEKASGKGATKGTSLFGLILTFIMLTQYNTWILIGVMEEKSSRVVEVLLAALRPVRLLAGKVLGIGAVAFAQAALIVVFALVLGAAVGSNILQGTAPLDLAATLVWLVLGYAFYCWVYAAAGSMAERQDQVQSLVFPLTLPILVGYIFSIITISSSPSLFFKVLAYIPLTAPFAMPTLVGFGDVTWWEFTASALISLAATFAVAKLAAAIYERAILRTGRRVTYREALSRSGA
jgi:ABC-2 type transport system permease protein